MDITNAEYTRIHRWLYRNYGKATLCEANDCRHNSNRFEWALVRGKKYGLERCNFIQLCSACHKRYDYTDSKRKKQSIAKIGNCNRGIQVKQLDKSGVLISVFKSARRAGKILGISYKAINNVLRGRSQSAGGFVWAYKN